MKKNSIIIVITCLVLIIACLVVMLYFKGNNDTTEDISEELKAAKEIYRIELNNKKDQYFIYGIKQTAILKGNSLVIPDSIDNIPVTKIIDPDNDFASFNKITSIKLGKNINYIGKNGYSVDINKIYGENIFLGVKSLINIEVDEKNETYSSIDGVLYNKDKTILLKYPAGRTIGIDQAVHSYKILDGTKSIYHGAFKGNTSLEIIHLPNTVEVIEKGAFSGCTRLYKVNLNDGLTTISEQAFYDCTSLDSINIPKTVLSIKSSAFNGCAKLSEITILSKLEFIGVNVFTACQSLKTIYVTNDNKEHIIDLFNQYNIKIDTEKIKVK